MTDIVDFTTFREKAKNDEFSVIFEELTSGFSDRAVAYLATQRPEPWRDAAARGTALTIVTAFLCKEACNYLIRVSKLQASSPEEFRRLCKALMPEKKPRR